MDEATIQKRIQATPQLAPISDALQREVKFRADSAFKFDPFLMVAIISIVIQVIIHCRERNSVASIRNSIRDGRAIPPRKLILLKRRLNKFWVEYCAQTGTPAALKNPLLVAVLNLGETIADTELDALLNLAEELRA